MESIDFFEMVKPKMGNAILEAASDFVAVPAVNRAQKRKMDRYAQKYCKNFEKLVKENQSLNVFKTIVALMRSGKTHLAISHNIPYILNNTDCQVAVITAPLSGIVNQNFLELQSVCAKNGFMMCQNPETVEKALEDGLKAVIYMTNSGAWTTEGSLKMFDEIISNKIMIATFMDESWTWTLSDEEVITEVTGNQTGKDGKYKASWYTIMHRIASYSPYTYGLSATETDQLNGIVQPTNGSMKYEIGFKMLIPKDLSHRLAWQGNVVYFSDSASLFGDVLPASGAFQKMIDSLSTIEKSSKTFYEQNGDKDGLSKRTALIQCNEKDGCFNIGVVKSWLELSNFECDDTDFCFAVLSSESTYLFAKNGDRQPCTEENVYKYLDDENHPLRFCLIMNMAKMGVTVRTWKEIFLFPQTEKMNKRDYIVYSRNQSMGRGLTPNCGRDSKTFWKQYHGDLSIAPEFPILLNTINLYVFENATNRRAVDVFMRDFCPTYEDFCEVVEESDCPLCGAAPEHQKKEIVSDKVRDNLNAALEII